MPNLTVSANVDSMLAAADNAAIRAAIGVDLASPGAIGGTTPAAGTFFTVTATGAHGTTTSAITATSTSTSTSIKLIPNTGTIEIAKSGNFATSIQFISYGFKIIDSGNTLAEIFVVDSSGVHAEKITSATTVGGVYKQLKVTSNYFPVSTSTPAINFFAYDAGSSDQHSKLEIYNGALGKMLLLPNGGLVGVGGVTTPTAGVDIGGDMLRVRTAKTPASATAAGNAGEFCWDSGYLYICIATNTWRRVAHATW